MTSAGAPRWRQLADQIAQEIRSGQRTPGSRLPSVADQDSAGFSQTTTLRAYRELVTQGLAVTVHGSGTYVADPVPNTQGTLSLEDHETRIAELERRLARLENQA